jgi:hypothetical protein
MGAICVPFLDAAKPKLALPAEIENSLIRGAALTVDVFRLDVRAVQLLPFFGCLLSEFVVVGGGCFPSVAFHAIETTTGYNFFHVNIIR